MLSMTRFQKMFNTKFKYPYVFMNNELFSNEFKTKIKETAVSVVKFVEITPHQWSYPAHIDRKKAEICMQEMMKANINYGGSLSYRHMCRKSLFFSSSFSCKGFYSGFFFRHESLKEYDWYWRLEPDVEFYCSVEQDPFIFMEENQKVYGFNIDLYENRNVIETLGETV